MKDILLAAAVYIPAFILARLVAEGGVIDPLLCGWIAGCAAVCLRWQCPGLRVRDCH